MEPQHPAHQTHSTLRRFFPYYCVLAALVTFGYALWDGYQIDGDAVAYMDIGDLLRSHQWAGVVNAYWHPLYPAFLSLGHILFRATRSNELHAYYMVNFGIFLLEMLAIVTFTDALVRFRDSRATLPAASLLPSASSLFDRYALRYLGLGLLLIATQRELSMGKVRPDALLQTLLLFGLSALLTHLTTGKLRYAAWMGLALGLAYLTKSFAFLFTLICIALLIAFRWFWQRHAPARIIAAAALATVCFAAVAGPYISALSRQKGHFDFGDSGALNYAWYVGGTEKMHLQQSQTALFGSAEVHLKHPERQLLDSPAVFSYAQLPYGTYPDWFDASFWNDGVKTHTNLHNQVPVIARDLVLIARYLLNHPEGWLLLAVLLVLGSRLALAWRPVANAFWLPSILLGLAIFAIYGMVNVEERYVTVGYFAILITLFATLTVSAKDNLRHAATALVVFFALLAAGESLRSIAELRRHLSVANSPGGWYDADTFRSAAALNAIGVGPGDTIACIGTRACLYDHYWARLAGVRILTEIYVPEPQLTPIFNAMPNRAQAISATRQQGGKVLVGYFDPGSMTGAMTGATPASTGWIQLDHTPFYALPLNLPPQPPATPYNREEWERSAPSPPPVPLRP